MVCIYIVGSAYIPYMAGPRFYRTTAARAAELVKQGLAAYCPKHEWKAAGRHYL